ncbi:hypothetical protein JCM9140_2100 [Halalkalibacter wakoensis JCM 9140]|uniref:ATP-grasp domain-containing protein n=1 Tax=Halalkalibacter wakoensis JCM 9140 TaxID=1236970 RepID=W4Q264_9BACI|nr:YheC/YheD family protein [Halalkalibacter wakoensis]GAE26072.1 hypothetical protein JCM9140_2100 [Halalkalibacter wakoensis JCM 9140]
MSTQYIGIMVDEAVYKGIKAGRTGYEEIDFYEEAGNHFGVTPCYFRFSDVEPDQNEISAYVKGSNGKYQIRTMPTPTVIHNRALQFSKNAKMKMDRLIKEGKLIYNSWNRFKKLDIHQVLMKQRALRKHLPETHKASEVTILEMLQKHKKVIIKPNSGSLGNGLMKIETKGSKYELNLYSKKEKGRIFVLFEKEIPDILKKNLRATSYVVQEYIPLSEYEDNVYDLRVSCQKNEKGKWQVSGIVGKVANEGNFITNVAQGGNTYPLDMLLEDSLDLIQVTKAIKSFAKKAAKTIEKEYPGMADLGIDIGLTKDGFPMFIECNGRDIRVTFRNAGMKETWKNTFFTPIGYGVSLLKTDNGE